MELFSKKTIVFSLIGAILSFPTFADACVDGRVALIDCSSPGRVLTSYGCSAIRPYDVHCVALDSLPLAEMRSSGGLSGGTGSVKVLRDGRYAVSFGRALPVPVVRPMDLRLFDQVRRLVRSVDPALRVQEAPNEGCMDAPYVSYLIVRDNGSVTRVGTRYCGQSGVVEGPRRSVRAALQLQQILDRLQR